MSTDSLYNWLPEGLRNDFIKSGHNKYSPAEHPVREAKKSLRGTVRSARQLGRAGVLTAKATGGDVKAAKLAKRGGVLDAEQRRRDVIGAAQRSKESAGMEKYASAGAKRSKRAGNLEARAKRLRGGMTVSA